MDVYTLCLCNSMFQHVATDYTACVLIYADVLQNQFSSTHVISHTVSGTTINPQNTLPSSFLPSPLFSLVDLVELLWEPLWRGCHAECGVQLNGVESSITHAQKHTHVERQGTHIYNSMIVLYLLLDLLWILFVRSSENY